MSGKGLSLVGKMVEYMCQRRKDKYNVVKCNQITVSAGSKFTLTSKNENGHVRSTAMHAKDGQGEEPTRATVRGPTIRLEGRGSFIILFARVVSRGQ